MKKSKTLKLFCVAALCVTAAAMLFGCGYKWKTFEIYASWLAESPEFAPTSVAEPFPVDDGLDEEILVTLKTDYALEGVAGTGTNLDKTINLLAWVADHVTHDGSKNVTVERETAWHFLQHAYGKTENGINCRQVAVVLNDCLRSVGIPSRQIFLMPKEADSGDNHVGNMVYIEELGKWIVVDPSWNAFFQDGEGKYLDVFELRDAYANGAAVTVNPAAHHNHEVFDEGQQNYYKKYMAKNLYWFESSVSKKDGMSMIPTGFDLNGWYIENQKMMLDQKYITKEQYDKNVEYYKTAKFYIYSKADFLRA